MDVLKRKLVFNETLNESNHSINSIENLSNEIFYEIFDYFDGGEIVKIFSKLNSRFEQLLHSSFILIKTHFYLFYYEEIMNKDHELEIFSNKLCSNLKILFINCSQNIIFFDAHRWEQLILHYYPQLEKFYLTYYDGINNNNQYPIYTGPVNQFSSSFWIQRKWIFHVQINGIYNKYMIYPYKKTWYNYIDDNNIEYSTSTSLIFTHFLTSSYDEMIFEQIKRVLTITKIYHLSISKEHSIHLAIQLINVLRDLITLKIHSLPSDETTSFTFEEFCTIASFKSRSKIAKVYIEEINDINDFHNISLFCPRMKFLQVKRFNINIQLCLRTFLKDIYNNNDICSIRSLCFDVRTMDDEIIQNFDIMIRSEKLLFDYTIKHVYNKIYLQWK
ncbi:unnamed protein product [Rotaria magnacalcarata]|uniref:F-box domain-containing protein n=1 Tax=Rotaria magnacalcarata TaxID=392030 RepID=A0A816WC81_9BILA|nr:unnamed protein product [Rotaria magnacalcarata]CAF2131278.1 unnamed protein product [Rotaria magnacalcarata]CAF2225122.1 unnamed protein product [Rotaria magnacalcarata]CAF4089838.1 unnamed protein product [Rotaria magnacalcarata]CAF4272825.1 unnamed protein product [Rotaria magnacalcarata]